ncbi:MAG: N-acetylmuramoyl-L-alanine amidase [Aquificota bacterium]|nr:MAG: N-acetylmuramoyl-L-alanine amidase [Aquificota bacterium]
MFPMTLAILLSFLLSFAQTAIVRVGKYPDKERVVLQFDKKVEYRVFTLENPKRVVVDLMEDVEVSLPASLKARVGRHPWGKRLVLEQDFSYVKAFSLEEPYRIVIDVYTDRDKKPTEEELIAILEPSLIKVFREMPLDEEGKRLVGENRGNSIITRKRVVVVDAGHGGHDPGAVGYMGVKEKDVNLAIAKRLAKYLEQDGRFKVIMTRKGDYFVPLQERARIALENRADLFISIHANASPYGISPHASGTMVFAISHEAAKKKKEQIIRNREYAKLVLGNEQIPDKARVVLADLAMDVTLSESVVFGRRLALSLGRELKRDVEFKGIQRAGFAVLKTPGIPSLLIETGFITNPKEALLLADPSFQDAFAKAVYLAIVDYFFPESRKVTLAPKTYAPAE